jgi:hypothetical protein
MNIIYNRIMNLVVGHDYFEDGFDRFVSLYPTTRTEKLFRNGKMLFKKLPHGITVLYQTIDDGVTPFIALEKEQLFTFIVKAENKPRLLAVSDLDESPSRPYKTGNIIFFTNNPANASVNKYNPEILSQTIIDSIRGPLFTYQFSLNGNPSSVKMIVTSSKGNPVSVGKDAAGNPLPGILQLSADGSNMFNQQIDLRNFQRGRFQITIKTEDESVILKNEAIYVDEQLEKGNILGIVEIVYETGSGNLYNETEEYKLLFRKSDTYWKYYIVNKSRNIDFETNSLVIADAAVPNGLPYEINEFLRAYASIELTAKNPGEPGNSVVLEYSGGGDFPAVNLSGKTLSGGANGAPARGVITIVNSNVTGYTVKINGTEFKEGTDFSNGTTPAETATNLADAINGNGSVPVVASKLSYDILINNNKTLVFSSSQKIPYYEKPKLKIELRQTSDNETVVSNLANPSPGGIKKSFAGRLESEVFVFI